MEKVGPLWEAYSAWADAQQRALLTYVFPEHWDSREMDPLHPYTEGWPLTELRHALAIAAAYTLFVLLGSAVMHYGRLPALNKELYYLKFFYNIAQVMLCSYMCIEAVMLAVRNGYNIFVPCNAFDWHNPPVANVLWIFYVSKVFDFFDTIFIILGKKWKQLSFLHVYHHISIFLFYWLNTCAGFDGDIFLTVVLNGFIHTVMYTYYFVSMHADKDKIWWKPALTGAQMLQFVLMNAQAIYLIFVGCRTYPLKIVWAYLIYILSLLVLFANFFVQSYFTKGKKGKKSSSKSKHS